MPYSPSGGAVSKQLPFGMSNLPLDAKLMYDDTVNFTKRAFISTSEILGYFPEGSPFRDGSFEILLNTGGTLSNGVITGGVESIWWFSRGDLIQKYYTVLQVNDLISGITPVVPGLQQVTTVENTTSDAVQFVGINSLNTAIDSLAIFGGTETGLINIIGGQGTGALGFKPTESRFVFQTSAAPDNQYYLVLRAEDETTSGAIINRRLQVEPAINPNDVPIFSQLDDYQLLSLKGVANGYAPLDGSNKVPLAFLPAGFQTYKGIYNASTNTPTLINGTGTAGDTYRVTVAGIQNFGAGNITFSVGDDVIYNGTIWERNPSSGGVTLGITNGLSLSGQELSLGLSSTSTTGALNSTDWNTFNNKQPAGSYELTTNFEKIPFTGATGIINVDFTLNSRQSKFPNPDIRAYNVSGSIENKIIGFNEKITRSGANISIVELNYISGDGYILLTNN